MKKVKSIFKVDQVKMFKEIGINISDDKDYSDDELDEIYDNITEHYQIAAFDEYGNPKPIASVWEDLIDVFYEKTNR